MDIYETHILRKVDIKFYRKRRKLMHISNQIYLEEKVFPIFRTQKNGVKKAIVTQSQTGKHLCPVKIWDYILAKLESYPRKSDESPTKTLWVKISRTRKTSQTKIKTLMSGTLYFGEEHIGLSHKEVGTH